MKNPFARLLSGLVLEIDDDDEVQNVAVAVPSGQPGQLPEMIPDPVIAATSLDTLRPAKIGGVFSEEMSRQLLDIDTMLLRHDRPSRAQLSTMVAAIVQKMPTELQRELDMDDRRHRVIEGLAGIMEQFIATRSEHDAEATEQEIARVTAQMIEVLLGDHVDTLVHGPLVVRPNDAERGSAVITSGHRGALTGKRVTELALWVFSWATTFMGVSQYAGIAIEELESYTGYEFPNHVQEWMRWGIGAAVGILISQTVIGIKHAVERIANTEGVGLIGRSGECGAYRRYLSREWKQRKPSTVLSILILILDGLTNMSGVVAGVGLRRDMKEQIATLTGKIDKWEEELAQQTGGLDRRYAKPLGDSALADLDKEERGESVSGIRSRGPIWHAKEFLYNETGASHDYLARRKGDHSRDLLAALDRSPLTDGKTLDADIRGRVTDALSKVSALLAQAKQQRTELDPGLSVEDLQAKFDLIEGTLNAILPILNKDLPADLQNRVDGYVDVQKAILDIVRREYPNADLRKFDKLGVEAITLSEIKLDIGDMEFHGVWELIQEAFKGQPQLIQGLLLALAIAIGIGLSQGDQLFISGTRKAYNEDAARADAVKAKLFWPLIQNLARVIARILSTGPYSRFFKDCEIHPRVVMNEIKKRIMELAGPDAKVGLNPAHWTTTTFAADHNRRVRALLQIADDPAEIDLIVKRLLPANAMLDSANPNADVTGRMVEQNTAHVVPLNNVAYRDVIRDVLSRATDMVNGNADFFSADDHARAVADIDTFYQILERIRTFNYEAPVDADADADTDADADQPLNPNLEAATIRALEDADSQLEIIEARVYDKRLASIAREALLLARRGELSSADLRRSLEGVDRFTVECTDLETDMQGAADYSRASLDSTAQSLARARVNLFTLRFRTIQQVAGNDCHASMDMSPDDMLDAHRSLDRLDSECHTLQTNGVPDQCLPVLETTLNFISSQKNSLDKCRLEQILSRCVAATEALRSDRSSLDTVDAAARQYRVDHQFATGLVTSDPVTLGMRTRALAGLEMLSARFDEVRQAQAIRQTERVPEDLAQRVAQADRQIAHDVVPEVPAPPRAAQADRDQSDDIDRGPSDDILIYDLSQWSREFKALPDGEDVPAALLHRLIDLIGLDGEALLGDGFREISAQEAVLITEGLQHAMRVTQQCIDSPTHGLFDVVDLQALFANLEEVLAGLRSDNFPG